MPKRPNIMMKSDKNKLLKYILTFFVVASFSFQSQQVKAQEVSFGGDFANRYVWRGIDFGNSASIQPYIEYNSGGFTLGTWASYAISPVDNPMSSAFGASEHDIYLGYSFGSVSVGVTDYYFPAASKFFNFDSDGVGSHVIEPNISFTGSESFPVTVYGAINAYNDPDNSVYLEASVPFQVGETELGLAVGGVPAETAYYGTTSPGIININLSVAREAAITDTFGLPLFASYILNPYAEQSYLVFGFSL